MLGSSGGGPSIVGGLTPRASALLATRPAGVIPSQLLHIPFTIGSDTARVERDDVRDTKGACAMSNRSLLRGLAVAVLAVAAAAAIGIGAYNAGVAHGIAEGGRAITAQSGAAVAERLARGMGLPAHRRSAGLRGMAPA